MAYPHPLDVLPAGARLHSVTASASRAQDRPALRVELTDLITREGVAGIDYVDMPTFVELPVVFSGGSLQVDVLSRLNGKTDFESRAFAGVAYHVAEDLSAFEAVYLRPLNGLRMDPPPPRDRRAIQYFAYPDAKFDRLRAQFPDGRYEAAADIAADEWITLLIDVTPGGVTAVVNGTTVLRIDRPLGARDTGTIGLFVDIGTEAHFRDLVVSETQENLARLGEIRGGSGRK